MALTGLQHEVNAMYHLGTLKAGGTPSSDQQSAFLVLLNEMLEQFQLAKMLGYTKTTTISGKSDAIAVSTAGVVTQTNTGGTITTVDTPVAVATYASVGTSNTYPVGWDEMIDYNLAVAIAGAQGAALPEHVLAKAEQTRIACTPVKPQEVAAA
jgi:hypothetical protein